MILYSQSNISFYDDAVHSEDQIPVDAIEITQEMHHSLLIHLSNSGGIKLSGNEFILLPPQPDKWHIWNEEISAWETNATLQAAKLENWRENIAEITPKQLRLVLLSNGITAAIVETAIGNITDEVTREIATIEWQYGTGYSRTNANLQMIATQLLGFSQEQIDEMWKHALTL